MGIKAGELHREVHFFSIGLNSFNAIPLAVRPIEALGESGKIGAVDKALAIRKHRGTAAGDTHMGISQGIGKGFELTAVEVGVGAQRAMVLRVSGGEAFDIGRF